MDGILARFTECCPFQQSPQELLEQTSLALKIMAIASLIFAIFTQSWLLAFGAGLTGIASIILPQLDQSSVPPPPARMTGSGQATGSSIPVPPPLPVTGSSQPADPSIPAPPPLPPIPNSGESALKELEDYFVQQKQKQKRKQLPRSPSAPNLLNKALDRSAPEEGEHQKALRKALVRRSLLIPDSCIFSGYSSKQNLLSQGVEQTRKSDPSAQHLATPAPSQEVRLAITNRRGLLIGSGGSDRSTSSPAFNNPRLLRALNLETPNQTPMTGRPSIGTILRRAKTSVSLPPQKEQGLDTSGTWDEEEAEGPPVRRELQFNVDGAEKE